MPEKRMQDLVVHHDRSDLKVSTFVLDDVEYIVVKSRNESTNGHHISTHVLRHREHVSDQNPNQQ